MASLDGRVLRLEAILNPPPVIEDQHPLEPCESPFGFCGCAADDRGLSERRVDAVYADVDRYVDQVASRHRLRADAPQRTFELIRWDIFKYLGLWPHDGCVLSLMLMVAERIATLADEPCGPDVELELVAQVIAVRLARESRRDYGKLLTIARNFCRVVHRRIARGELRGPGPWTFGDVADVLLHVNGGVVEPDPDRPRLVEIAREELDDIRWLPQPVDERAVLQQAEQVLRERRT